MYFNDKNFSLVLSGGGALGIAHLGVLHDMEKAHLLPKEIVGTSMGGIIGACYAIGMREQQIFALCAEFSKITNWIRFSFSGNAIITGKKIETIFDRVFGEKKMVDTIIPLKIITTDTLTGNKRCFTTKDDILIRDVLLATMAIPGVFEEKSIEDHHYSDGFLCENLGITEATHDDILAVDVLGSTSYDTTLPDNFFKTKNVLEMFERSIRLLIYNQSKTNLAHCDKNIVLLEPETRKYNTYDFHKYREIRELGIGLLSEYYAKDSNF